MEDSIRSEGPAVARPGRQAGIESIEGMSAEGAVQAGVSPLRGSTCLSCLIPGLRPGLASAGPSGLQLYVTL
jgi:hypothetical protein